LGVAGSSAAFSVDAPKLKILDFSSSFLADFFKRKGIVHSEGPAGFATGTLNWKPEFLDTSPDSIADAPKVKGLGSLISWAGFFADPSVLEALALSPALTAESPMSKILVLST